MKDDFIIYGALAGLVIAFLIVSAIVFITNGSSAKFISRKLKLGALILTLTASISTGCKGPLNPENPEGPGGGITCYDVAMVDDMIINNYSHSEAGWPLNLKESNQMSGKIMYRQNDAYSFRLTDANEKVYQIAPINALDGDYDESTEEFRIALNKNINSGLYYLECFNVGTDGIGGRVPLRKFILDISN